MLPNSRRTGVPLPAGSIPAPRANLELFNGGMNMAEKKAKVVNIPGSPAIVIETADQAPVRRALVNGVAVCGKCGVRLVDFDGVHKCKFCWNCGKPVLWR